MGSNKFIFDFILNLDLYYLLVYKFYRDKIPEKVIK